MECETTLKIKSLLRAGAMVNTVDNLVSLCSKSQRRRQRKKELAHLLIAAGETYSTMDFNAAFPGCLIDLCRNAIRNHLLHLNHVNLFYRVPKLGLPASMTKYVLCGESVTE